MGVGNLWKNKNGGELQALTLYVASTEIELIRSDRLRPRKIKQYLSEVAYGSTGDDVLVQCLQIRVHRACGVATPDDIQQNVFIRPIDITVAPKIRK